MSEINKSKYGYGQGIKITTGFDVSSKLPLDLRTVVQTQADLDNISDNIKYEGLLVFVVNQNKLYQWKQELLEDGTYAEEYSWGPIESEISAKKIDDISEIDFANTKSLQMQKNKVNFFPITHDKFIYNDAGISLDTRLEDTIKSFENDMDDMKAMLQKKIDDMLAELQQKSEEMDQSFDALLEDLKRQIAELQDRIQDDINRMLQDIDNSILSDLQVDNLMTQINANIAALDENSVIIVAESFEAYEAVVIVDTKVSEISMEGLGVDVTPEDKLFVHINSVYLTKDVDYSIDYDSQKIVCLTEEKWNSYELEDCEFAFDLIKKTLPMIDGDIIPGDGDGSTILIGSSFKSYEAILIIDTEVTEVSLSGLGDRVSVGDELFVHFNSIYLTPGVDYELDTARQKLVCLTGSWNKYNIKGCEFAFDLIKKVVVAE